MSRRRFEPTWPFLCILVCLFVLCAVSPSIWGTMLKRRTTRVAEGITKAASLVETNRTPEAPVAESPARSPAAVSATAASSQTPPAPSQLPDKVDADPQTHTPGSHAADPAESPTAPDRAALAAELQPAQIAPPVAGRPVEADAGIAAPKASEAARKAQPPSSEPSASPESTTPAAPSPVDQKPVDEASTVVEKLPAAQPAPVVDAMPSGSEAAPSAAAVVPGPVLAEESSPARVAMRPREARASDADAFESLRNLLLPQEPLPRGVLLPDGAARFRKPWVDSAEPDRANDATPAVARRRWPEPKELAQTLQRLTGTPATRSWAERALHLLPRIARAMEDASLQPGGVLEEAAELCDDARRIEQRIEDPALAGDLARTAHALERRVSVWRRVAAAGGLASALPGVHRDDPRRLSTCLAVLDNLTREDASGRSWAQYLALDSLRQMAEPTGRAAPRDTARRVLDRLTLNPMSRVQRRFVESEPVTALAAELRRWAGRDVPAAEILESIERYESEQLSSDAKAVAEICRNLTVSQHRNGTEIAGQIESYYRNANVRLAVSRELLNRLIPARSPERDCVDDVVLGSPVRGERTTTSKVRVQLIPDPQRLRLALEVTGNVSAATHSTSGPATFYNHSRSVYRAWKEIEIGPDGLRVKPAEVAVDNDTALDDVETNFDRIPLVGALAQEVARSQHAHRRGEMNSEVEDRVYQQAKDQVDTEADARVNDFAERIQRRLLDPLGDLSVGPTVISAETTERRVVLRMRIASEGQLGAHTPRPRAPADSVASFQIHQSAFNNLIEQMQLDGCSFRVSELRRRLAARTGQPQLAEGDGENDDIALTFAPHDALQVRCEQGKLAITLRIARLEREGQHWDNFQVRAFYRPEIQQRAALLVRDDSIHLLGDKLSARSQIPLRGIFGRVFAKDRPLSLLPAQFANDARLAGIVVSRFEIDQGWIAVALTEDRPDRPAAATAARRKAN